MLVTLHPVLMRPPQTSYGDYLVDGDGHGTHVAGVIGAVGNNDSGIVGGKSGKHDV